MFRYDKIKEIRRNKIANVYETNFSGRETKMKRLRNPRDNTKN